MMQFTPKDINELRKDIFKYFPEGVVSDEFDLTTLENVFHRLENEKTRYKGFAEIYFPALDGLTPDEKSEAWDKFIEEMYQPYEILQGEVVGQFRNICRSHVFLSKQLRDIKESLKEKIFNITWSQLFNPDKKWSYVEVDIQNYITYLIPFIQAGLLDDNDK